MNKTIQFLNKFVIPSICIHLIGVTVVSLSIGGSANIHQDAIVAEVFVVHKAKPILTTPRPKRIIPESTQPAVFDLQVARIQPAAEVTQVPQNQIQLFVERTPLPAEFETTSSIGYGKLFASDTNRREFSPALIGTRLNSHVMSVTPKRAPKSAFTIPTVPGSVQVDELPPPSMPLDEPTQDAQFLRKVEPLYPASARFSHKQGSVLLEATIGVDGKAKNIQVIEVTNVSGLGCEQAAITALKASEFIPAMSGKVTVSQRIRIPYRFSLKN